MLSRGQRLDTRDWKIGNYVHHQYGAHQIYIPEGVDKDGFDSYHIDPKTLGWSTDHRDVNDKYDAKTTFFHSNVFHLGIFVVYLQR